jgi:DNA repair protein RadD
MPGGSGKSVVIGAIARDALQNWPETRVLMAVHSKELIAQNADKLRKMWQDVPLGIYSASLKQRNLGEPVTYAGVQSIYNKAAQIGFIDLCIIDEVQAVSHKDTGMYRKLIADLMVINPAMRLIGLSASPYRLGHGLITEGYDAIFTSIIEPVGIEELVFKGYLVPLRSKVTTKKLDATGLHKLGGEYKSSEMEAKYNTRANNQSVVSELIEKASERSHWLIFCSGIKHSENIAAELNSKGIKAASLSSHNSMDEREELLRQFEAGEIRALCNVGILTTGYDFPALDCIVFLRSTMSPGLYLQMAVRGMRTSAGKADCLVLDFAGVVQVHGPITAVQPPRKAGPGNGEAPVKVCDNCGELVAISCMVCPACGHAFPPRELPKLALRGDDIMGLEGNDLEVTSWSWRKHISRASGNEMLACTYYGSLSDKPVSEYWPIMNDGYAGQRSRGQLAQVAQQAGSVIDYGASDLEDIAASMNAGKPPRFIEFKLDGKFYRVLKRSWE